MDKRWHKTKLVLFLVFNMFWIGGCLKKDIQTRSGIVVTSPEVAEIICSLGSCDKLIARTKYCDYPAEILKVESIGDFSSIDLERLIELKPEIVFTASMEQGELPQKLKPFGIEVIEIHSNSISSFYDNIRLIGDKIGQRESAQLLISDFSQTLNSLVIPEQKPKVYFEISPNLGTITDNSFIGDMISKAGGLNIFSEYDKDFFIAKNEQIVQANPDVIIALSYVSQDEIANRRGWQDITAVKEGHIYTVDNVDIDTVMRTIPRSVEAIKSFNQWFLNYDQ